jgi:hypothetical protein
MFRFTVGVANSGLNNIFRAYRSLKYWFDPSVDGNPYIKDIEVLKPATDRKPFFSYRRMSWR